jgi:hypothetical protein
MKQHLIVVLYKLIATEVGPRGGDSLHTLIDAK